MIQNISQSLKFISDYLIILGVYIFGIIILFSFLFNNTKKKVQQRFTLSFILTIIFNVISYLLLSLFIIQIAKVQTWDFEIIAYISILIFTMIFNLNLILKMKNTFIKVKKGGDIYESSKDIIKENSSKVSNLIIVTLIILFSVTILGNGSINGLIVLLLLSLFVSAFSSILLFTKILKFTENLFK